MMGVKLPRHRPTPYPMHHSLTWSECFKVFPGLARAARMAVVVVPMLEPSVSGYALSMDITPRPRQGGKDQN